MKLLIYTNKTGMAIIVYPAYNDLARNPDQTDDELIQQCIKNTIMNTAIYDKDGNFIKHTMSIEDILVAESSEINFPKNRYFRHAWKLNNKKIEIDMPKACNIKMDKLKIKRNEKFKELDVEYQIADEQEDIPKKKEVATKKQKLRDMPQNEDLSKLKTPDELQNYIPDYLL